MESGGGGEGSALTDADAPDLHTGRLQSAVITSTQTGFVNAGGRVFASRFAFIKSCCACFRGSLGHGPPVPAECRIAAPDSRLRPQPPLSPASLQPASRWALLMSCSPSPDMGLFFPGLEGGRGGEGRVLVGGTGRKGLLLWKSNFSDHYDGQFVHGCGQEGVCERAVSGNMVHPKTDVHPLLFGPEVEMRCWMAPLCLYSADTTAALLRPCGDAPEGGSSGWWECWSGAASPHAFVSCLFDVINMCCFHLVWPKIKKKNKSWSRAELCANLLIRGGRKSGWWDGPPTPTQTTKTKQNTKEGTVKTCGRLCSQIISISLPLECAELSLAQIAKIGSRCCWLSIFFFSLQDSAQPKCMV